MSLRTPIWPPSSANFVRRKLARTPPFFILVEMKYGGLESLEMNHPLSHLLFGVEPGSEGDNPTYMLRVARDALCIEGAQLLRAAPRVAG